MRFKLEKRCSKHFISRVVSLFFVLGLFAETHATIFVSPANGGSLSGGTTQGGRIYYEGYYDQNSTRISGRTFSRNRALNLSTDIIELNFYSDAAINLTGSQKAVITFLANPSTSPPHQAPIASFNGIPCSATSNCVAFNWSEGTNNGIQNHYYGAIYPASRSVVKIGFSLADLCRDAGNAITLTGTACSNGSLVTSPSGQVWSIQLTFAIRVSNDGGQATVPTTQSLDSMTGVVSLYFQSAASTFSCPSLSEMNNGYFPGENEILLNTSMFGITQLPGGAPMRSLIVVGKQYQNNVPGVTDYTSSFDSGTNDFISYPSLGLPDAKVGGFQNEINYTLSFLAQDEAGIFMSPSAGSCNMGPVQTARIQGFLPTKDKKCFIATATFKSSESAPVLILREFRDQFLLQYSAGKAFVNWYYSWSPGAADWLNEHPLFRFSSLLILFPIEGLAWLFLHPLIFMAIFGASCLITIVVVSHRLLKREGNLNEGL